VLNTVTAYSDYSCSFTEGHPTGAGHCFSTISETRIGSFEEKCGPGANDSVATSSSAIGTTGSIGMDGSVTTEAGSSVTSTQTGSGNF
jgi:hypothetical protein